MSKTTMTEARWCARAQIEWPVTVTTAEGTFEATTGNITPGGAFIRCARPLALNETCSLELILPNAGKRVPISATVIWANKYGPEGPSGNRGMGVRFDDVCKSDHRLITESILDHLEEQHEDPDVLRALRSLLSDK